MIDENDLVRSKSESMKTFAGNDKTINIGQWKRWVNACNYAGYEIDPEEFKRSLTRI